MKTIERIVPQAVEPEPSVPDTSVQLNVLRQEIAEALRGTDPSRKVAARAALERMYGSMDLAVTAAGALVQARADQIAGITGDEVKASHDRRIAESLAGLEAAKEALAAAGKRGDTVQTELLEELAESQDALKDAKAGIDPETAEEMRRLIECRVAALEEIQPMGGSYRFAPESRGSLAKAIDDAARYYPTSWIEISNSGREMLATGEKRGEGHYQATKSLVVKETSRRVETEVFGPWDLPLTPDPWGDYAPTGEKGANGVELYSREAWIVAHEGTPRDSSGKPTTAEAWEEWIHPETGEVHWRHPETQTKAVGTKKVSVIGVGTTVPANVAGMDEYHPVAAHEQAHRYEAVIQDVMSLEDQFLTRRTTLPDGTLEPVQRYSSGVNVRGDHFSEKYTGRRYADGATELLSTGMEGVFAGQYGGFLGIGGRLPDAELQNFVLGVLVSCDGKRADC